MDFILLYMTCADEIEARRIVSALLEARLIACANIMAPHTALYRWDGKVTEGREVAVLMKSSAAHHRRIEEEVQRLHSYDCPCLVSWPLTGGLDPFLRWIADHVGDTPGGA